MQFEKGTVPHDCRWQRDTFACSNCARVNNDVVNGIQYR